MPALRIAERKCDKDHTVSALLTAASWLLAQLPDRVREYQRADLVKTLSRAQDLVIEVH
jgi:hypothetical protein